MRTAGNRLKQEEDRGTHQTCESLNGKAAGSVAVKGAGSRAQGLRQQHFCIGDSIGGGNKAADEKSEGSSCREKAKKRKIQKRHSEPCLSKSFQNRKGGITGSDHRVIADCCCAGTMELSKNKKEGEVRRERVP